MNQDEWVRAREIQQDNNNNNNNNNNDDDDRNNNNNNNNRVNIQLEQIDYIEFMIAKHKQSEVFNN